MKRRIILTITALCVVLSVFLAACTFDFSGCFSPPNESGTETPPQDPTATVAELSYDIIEKDSYYYPTFKGKVSFGYYPDKITLSCAGSEKELQPRTVTYENGYYTFTFEQVILCGSLKKGEYTGTVYGYSGKTKRAVSETVTLKADDDYEVCNIMNMETNETTSAMDKESNWTPAY